MAEKGFGAKEINLIGSSGTPTIESPGNLNLNANNVAISTNVSIGGTLSVTGNVSVGGTLTYEDVTNIDSVGLITARSGVSVTSGGIQVLAGTSRFNANIIGTATTAISVTTADESSDTSCNVLFATAATGNIAPKTGTNLTFNSSNGTLTATTFSGSGASLTNLPAANITGTLPAISGANLTGIAVTEAPAADYTITSPTGSYYLFHGGGVDVTSQNPTLYLERGKKYRFNNTTGSNHPFEFRNQANNAGYTDGITGSQNGVQFFTVPLDAPNAIKYRCTIHTGSMIGDIYINGGQYGGMTLLASATLSSSGTVAANITFNTAGFQYLYGKLYSVTRSGGGNVGDVGLRWNGTSSAVYDFVMQRMDNGGSGSERYTQGANQFYYNMQGVAAFTSGINQAVFELHLVNDGVRKPFNMKASGELSGGSIVLTTDGMLDLTAAVTSLEITSTNTDINGGTLELYGVR